jgi:hypothetical protein
VFFGLFHRVLDVFDRDVGPHNRALMRGKRLSDATRVPSA